LNRQNEGFIVFLRVQTAAYILRVNCAEIAGGSRCFSHAGIKFEYFIIFLNALFLLSTNLA